MNGKVFRIKIKVFSFYKLPGLAAILMRKMANNLSDQIFLVDDKHRLKRVEEWRIGQLKFDARLMLVA